MKGPTSKRYSEAFKRQIVKDLASGRTTEAEVKRQHGVSGSATIRGWIRKYGTVKKRRRAGGSRPPAQKSTERLLMLERKNRELEQALLKVTVEKVALESLIEEAQSHLSIDLKKTFGLGR